MIAYKIVRVAGSRLLSMFKAYQQEYLIGEKVKAPEGPLMCFVDEQSARKFFKHFDEVQNKYSLYTAEVELWHEQRERVITNLYEFMDLGGSLERYWSSTPYEGRNSHATYLNEANIVLGTLLCKTVKLLDRISRDPVEVQAEKMQRIEDLRNGHKGFVQDGM